MKTNLISNEQLNNVKITTLMDDLADSQKPYLAQHGISFFIEMQVNDKNQVLLFDTGQESEPVLTNIKSMNIDINSTDVIFLSHCHNDHTGGLVGILKEINKEIKVVGHSDIFRETYKKTINCEKTIDFKYKGISKNNNREEIEKNGGIITLLKEPAEIMPGVISTGEIKKELDINKVSFFNKENGKLVPDLIKDDMSLILKLKDKGLFIVTGCSHAGILEIIEQSIKVTGCNDVYGLIGGLHLLNKNEEEIKATISKLEKYNLQLIVAGHCTGLLAKYLLSKKYKDKFKELCVGKIITL
jgi:7,8-dihydropterin-6-yl-methyl-4-(beta-D-ribofuranosyl)aminobenzene 5'-phosphate synthase